MRKQELHIFDAKRPADADFDRFFVESVGFPLPRLSKLGAELFNDLDPTHHFGIGWWHAYATLGEKRRILIADALCQAVQSVSDNLVEAKLHLFESLEWFATERKQMRDAVSIDISGQPRMRPLMTAKEGIAQRMIHLHGAGFFRAINSALDCLGATIVGVAALPTRILTSDLGQARKALRAIALAGSPGEALQTQLRTDLDALIGNAGPAGWLEWAANFRNMLTHRGRRMQFGHIHVEMSKVTNSRGRPHAIARVERSLPTEPGWCEVEAALQPRGLMLDEHSSETMEGILASTVFVIEHSGMKLLELWRARRASPNLLEQPISQWPSTQPSPSTQFEGYSGKLSGMGDQMVMNPSDILRLRSAALTTDDRHRWDTFS